MNLIFIRLVKRVILMYRVAKAIRIYALTRQTEREVSDLYQSLTHGQPDQSMEEKVDRLVLATRRHDSLTEMQQKERDDNHEPWSVQTKHDRTRLFFNPKYFETDRAAMMPSKTRIICQKVTW